MADSVREKIISGFIDRLGTMTTTAGYVLGAGATVFRAVKDIETEDLPASVLWPGVEEAVNEYGRHSCKMKIRVESFVEFDGTILTFSKAQESLLADLKKCLFDMSVTISPGIDGIVYTGGGPAEFPRGEDTATAAYVEFDVQYNEGIGDPYN